MVEQQQPQWLNFVQECFPQCSKDALLKAFKETNYSQDEAIIIDWIENHPEAQINQDTASQQIQEEVKNDQGQQQNQEQQQQQGGGGEQVFDINDLLDKQILESLTKDFGYSEKIAKKAMILTLEQRSVNAAIDWIDENKDNVDYEEDIDEETYIKIVTRMSKKKKVYTEEEIKEQKKILEEKIKQIKAKKALEEEANYHKKVLKERENQKAYREMEAIQKDQQFEREQEAYRRKKEKDKIELEKMRKEVEDERIRKFGKKVVEQQQQQEKAKELSQYEKFQLAVQSILTASPKDTYPDKAKNCITLIKTFSANLLKQPFDDKYRNINKEKEQIQNLCLKCFGAKSAIQLVGFEEEEKTYTYKGNINQVHVQQCVNYLEQILPAL